MQKNAKIFLKLPVADVYLSRAFFSGIGFDFNAKLSNDDCACLIISDKIFVLLIDEKQFSTMTDKKTVNSKYEAESIIAIGVERKDDVNDLVEKAFYSGAKALKDLDDGDTQYSWSFQDLDGHNWEIIYFYPSAD